MKCYTARRTVRHGCFILYNIRRLYAICFVKILSVIYGIWGKPGGENVWGTSFKKFPKRSSRSPAELYPISRNKYGLSRKSLDKIARKLYNKGQTVRGTCTPGKGETRVGNDHPYRQQPACPDRYRCGRPVSASRIGGGTGYDAIRSYRWNRYRSTRREGRRNGSVSGAGDPDHCHRCR